MGGAKPWLGIPSAGCPADTRCSADARCAASARCSAGTGCSAGLFDTTCARCPAGFACAADACSAANARSATRRVRSVGVRRFILCAARTRQRQQKSASYHRPPSAHHRFSVLRSPVPAAPPRFRSHCGPRKPQHEERLPMESAERTHANPCRTQRARREAVFWRAPPPDSPALARPNPCSDFGVA